MDFFLQKNGKKTLYTVLYAAGLYVCLRYCFGFAAPFLIAFFLVSLSYPRLKKLQQRTHIRKEILLGGILVSLAALLFSGLWGLVSWSSVHAAQIGEEMGVLQGRMETALHHCCLFLEKNWGWDGAQVERTLWERVNTFCTDWEETVLPEMTRRTWQYGKQIAGAAAFIGVSFLSALLLCRDYESILGVLQNVPVFDTARRFAKKTVSAVGGYLRAQGTLMLLVMAAAAAGLLLGRVQNAVWLAILTGLLDALPFIGSGLVLMPVALWQLLKGNFWGAGCAVVSFAVCVTGRELLEPRLLGKQAGMYPVVMLFSVYAGVKLFGLGGIFLGPLYAVLFREGVREVWRSR